METSKQALELLVHLSDAFTGWLIIKKLNMYIRYTA